MSDDFERALQATATEIADAAEQEGMSYEEFLLQAETSPLIPRKYWPGGAEAYRLSQWSLDTPPETGPDAGKTPGFCAGCGAHHVREIGRMFCVDCNSDFRDIS
jgi:hypothetical protein